METCKRLLYTAVILAVILTVNVFGDTSYSDIDPNGDGTLSLGSSTARWDANLAEVSAGDITQFILGDEIVTHGDFDAPTDWTFGGDWSLEAPGQAQMVAAGFPNSGALTQDISGSMVVGKTYRLVYTIGIAGNPTFSVRPTVSGTAGGLRTTAATWTQDFTPTAAGILSFAGEVTGGTGFMYVDDVSLKEVITTLISVTSTNRISQNTEIFGTLKTIGDITPFTGNVVSLGETDNEFDEGHFTGDVKIRSASAGLVLGTAGTMKIIGAAGAKFDVQGGYLAVGRTVGYAIGQYASPYTARYALKRETDGATNLCNYAADGEVIITANTVTAGAAGKVEVARFTDTDIALKKATTIGDDTNETAISATGDMSFVGSATIWDDIILPLDFARVPASNAPDWEDFVGNLHKFAYEVGDFQEFTAELLHGYKEGSAFIFHIHGALNALTAQEEKVQFEIEYSVADTNTTTGIGDVFPDGSGSLLTHELVVPNATPDLSNIFITIGVDTQGTFAIGATIVGRVRRIAKSAGGNELTGNIFVTQVGIHYERDTVGSRTELTK